MEYGSQNPSLAFIYGAGAKIEEKNLRPLDPIAPTTVGRVKIHRALSDARVLGLILFATIIDVVVGAAPPWVKEISQNQQRSVRAEYREHFEELQNAGLLRKRDAGWARYHSSYFEVEKGQHHSRAIFNGKKLSALCPAPPGINLITHRGLVEALRGRRYVLEVDLRHWFHQIPVSDELQRLFGLRCGTRFFSWASLPMGWSWSPAVAQTLGWLLWVRRKPQQGSLFDTSILEDPLCSHPRWMRTRSGRVWVTVYYDNLVAFGSSLSEMEQLRSRLQENCRELNAEVKGDPWRIKNVDTEEISVLGVTCRREGGQLRVWPRKLHEWRKEKPKEQLTWREASSYVGRILFAASLHSDNLRRSTLGKEGLTLARKIGTKAATEGWDSVHPTDPALIEAWEKLKSFHQLIVPEGKNEPRAPSLVIATDASEAGWGLCAYRRTEDGKLSFIEEKSGFFDGSDGVKREDHIFFKELYAARVGADYAHAAGERCDLVVDNSAVAWCLRTGGSRNQRACDLMEQHEKVFSTIDRVFQVVSADNPADTGSRGAVYDPEREKRMQQALDMEEKGARRASQKNEHTGLGQLRHEAPPDQADDLTPPEEDESDKRARE